MLMMCAFAKVLGCALSDEKKAEHVDVKQSGGTIPL